jgi:hypothetical protein
LLRRFKEEEENFRSDGGGFSFFFTALLEIFNFSYLV